MEVKTQFMRNGWRNIGLRPKKRFGSFGISPIGFTLVELLTTIAMVGLVSGLAIIAISKAKASAFAAKDLSNLRQTASLIHWASPGTPARRQHSSHASPNGITFIRSISANRWALSTFCQRFQKSSLPL